MTVSHHTASLAVDDLDAAVATLRERGLRVSSARRLVLEALFAADAAVTAESIAAGLGGRLPRSDLTSVYRNLEVFEELGLVHHVHLGHGPGLYALASDDARDYLVCERCSDVLALEPGALDELRDSIRERFGYEASFGHFPIVGRCSECAGR